MGYHGQNIAKFNTLNRGIGGAVVDDITYYLNDLVFPYNPRQIVLYVGENDLPDESESAQDILNKTIALWKGIRAKLPEVPIVYINFKPSPSRDKYALKAVEANKLIKDFILQEKGADYVDVYSLMLDKQGKSMPELFVEDMLHMNRSGYRIWEKAVKHHLLKK